MNLTITDFLLMKLCGFYMHCKATKPAKRQICDHKLRSLKNNQYFRRQTDRRTYTQTDRQTSQLIKQPAVKQKLNITTTLY